MDPISGLSDLAIQLFLNIIVDKEDERKEKIAQAWRSHWAAFEASQASSSGPEITPTQSKKRNYSSQEDCSCSQTATDAQQRIQISKVVADEQGGLETHGQPATPSCHVAVTPWSETHDQAAAAPTRYAQPTTAIPHDNSTAASPHDNSAAAVVHTQQRSTNQTQQTIIEETQENTAEATDPQTQNKPKNLHRRLTNKEKQLIVQYLLQNLKPSGRPKHKEMKNMALKHDVSDRTIRKIWTEARGQMDNGEVIDVRSKYSNSGRKAKEIDPEVVKAVPLSRRGSMRSLAKALGISVSSVWRLKKRRKLNSHSNAIKPFLTTEGIKKRLRFCIGKIMPHTLNSTQPMFEDMFNSIHIDEKWFYMTRVNQRYYLWEDEEIPERFCAHKHHIVKVMFLSAVARPIFDNEGNCLFDGKIGMFPFIVEEAAKRASKNRPKGTIEVKAITSITKQVIRDCLIQKVLPAIKEKWPEWAGKQIFIQQDNARPHISSNDEEFMQAASEGGWDIQITHQPANSPDLNVLDLGFFNSIQSLMHEKAPRTVAELVDAVDISYENFCPITLNKVWLSLQYCMSEIIKIKGSNSYKVPHVGKDGMIRRGTLPVQVTLSQEDVRAAIAHLNDGIIDITEYTSYIAPQTHATHENGESSNGLTEHALGTTDECEDYIEDEASYTVYDSDTIEELLGDEWMNYIVFN